MHIRKAEASDLPHVRDCLALAFEQYRADYTPAMFENTVHSALSAGQYLPALTLVSPDKSRSPHLALGLSTPRDARRRLWAPRESERRPESALFE
ncbi:MAG TPA: hypothetical protein VFP85_05280, partial [Vicinamibacterales bacterium]|nr:hypothetical protein [Vicinamibacterales bacterium]